MLIGFQEIFRLGLAKLRIYLKVSVTTKGEVPLFQIRGVQPFCSDGLNSHNFSLPNMTNGLKVREDIFPRSCSPFGDQSLAGRILTLKTLLLRDRPVNRNEKPHLFAGHSRVYTFALRAVMYAHFFLST